MLKKFFKNKDKSKDTSLITFGLVVVSLVFTIPIALLFYYMVHFRTESIVFAEHEIEGTSELRVLIQSLSSFDVDWSPVSKAREIGDRSNLILDPDLDSYYVMDIVVIRLPNLYAYYSDLKNPQMTEGQRSTLNTLIRDNIREFLISLQKAIVEDKNFYQTNKKLQSRDFFNRVKSLCTVIKQDLVDGKVQESTLKNIVDIWGASNDILESIVEQRLEYLRSDRIQVVFITLGLWILSLIFVYFFSLIIVKRQYSLYQEIEEQNLKLTMASKLGAIGEMSAGIAHEINTPLAAIRLYSESLLKENNDHEFGIEEADQIGRNISLVIDRISQIISSVRKISRDSSNDEMKSENFKKILDDCLILCGSNIKKNGVELNIDVSDDIFFVCRIVDISQVFINLINNAVDACRESEERQILITAKKEDRHVIIQISDSGPSLSNEVREKMFKTKFTTKAVGKGTGLGLWIVRRIIEQHSGEIILLDSKMTTIQITLPVDKEKSV